MYSLQIKASAVVLPTAVQRKLCKKAYSLFSYYKHSNNYKQDFTLTAEAGELCMRARVLKPRCITSKTKKQKP